MRNYVENSRTPCDECLSGSLTSHIFDTAQNLDTFTQSSNKNKITRKTWVDKKC